LKFQNKLLILFIVLIFSAINLYSGVIILINGKLTDKSTGKPIATKIKFIEESGKVHQSNSNSIDGKFQQVLPVGKLYDIVIDGWVIDNHLRTIHIGEYQEYTELEYNYLAEKISVGMIIGSDNIFEKNSSQIKTDKLDILKYVKEFTRNQRGIFLQANISSTDSYFNSKSIKESYLDKRGRKKIRTVKKSNEEQLRQLLDERKNALITKLNELGIPLNNITINTELVVIKPKVNKKSKKQVQVEEIFADNLIVKIEKVLKL